MSLSSFEGAASFSQLFFDVASACASCYITFDVRNASNGASLLASPFAASPTSPITLTSSAASVYVIARIKRSGGNTPKLNSVTLTTNANSLPIKLTKFNAKKQGKSNLIEWTTLTEVNNDFFMVEKSEDGMHFIDYKKEKGHGTSTIKRSYSLFDYEPFKGITYYRLKQTDFNGAYTYSDLVFVDRAYDNFEVKNVHPVPSEDVVFFDIESPAKHEIKIEVIDLVGNPIYSEIKEIESGITSTNISMRNLTAGVYMLKISSASQNEIIIRKLIKN